MLNNILVFILNFVKDLFNLFASVIFAPIMNATTLIFPDFNDFFVTLNLWINEYMFKGLSFAREVFFNITGYPRSLFNLLLLLLTLRLTFMLSFFGVRFFFNMYRLIRSGTTASSTISKLR